MFAKIVEILVILMDDIKRRGFAEKRLALLSDELQNRGYSKQEISTALSWIIDRMSLREPVPDPSPDSFRVLHNIERVFISPEAHGYLIQLLTLGIISPIEAERVIERIMMSSTPRQGLDELKNMVMEILFDSGDDFDLNGLELLPDD